MRTPLDTLIELAERRCDEAAKVLAAHLKVQAELQHRGATLEQYRSDYLLRLETVARAGIDGASLRNLRRFLARLDEAQAQQQRDAQACQARVAQARAAWQAAQRKMEAFAALERRRDAAQALHVRRIEQRVQDEAAARVIRVRAAANQEDRT
jgi:flagellar FliJ protein